MILAWGERDGRPLLLVGLSDGNLRLLRKERPVSITPETHPGCPKDLEIVIRWGPTESAMAKQLRDLGVVDDDTKVIAVAELSKRVQ